MSNLWRVLFLAEKYGRMTLTLDEVADQVGLAAGTIKNRRTRGEFGWLRADGRELYADVQDVASYLDAIEADAVAAARAGRSALAPQHAEAVDQLCALMNSQERIQKDAMPAVYCLLLGNEVVYVGQSRCLINRLQQHRMKPVVEWDAWQAVRVPFELLLSVEKELIRRYRPRGNTAGMLP